MDVRPEGFAHDFKELFERCLSEAGLTTRTLRLGILADTKQDLPENSIDSWRRPHTTTGQPSLPREETAAVVARWLSARDGVTATEDDLLAAWRADRAARAATRSAARPAGDEPGAPPARLGRGEFYEGIIDASIDRARAETLLEQAAEAAVGVGAAGVERRAGAVREKLKAR